MNTDPNQLLENWEKEKKDLKEIIKEIIGSIVYHTMSEKQAIELLNKLNSL